VTRQVHILSTDRNNNQVSSLFYFLFCSSVQCSELTCMLHQTILLSNNIKHTLMFHIQFNLEYRLNISHRPMLRHTATVGFVCMSDLVVWGLSLIYAM